MNSSTRLYVRLGQIPQDPNDPESFDHLVVCAFGAFERYYVCWKNQEGEYRQDGYGLPESLQEWLFPVDGSTRDFPSLQVVFGRGDEYFASDKNGKLEYKEQEVKKAVFALEPAEPIDKPAVRRSRTMSLVRPTSGAIAGATFAIESPTCVEVSSSPLASSMSSHPPLRSQWMSLPRPTSEPVAKPSVPVTETLTELTQILPLQSAYVQRRRRPLSMSYKPNIFTKIIEGKANMSSNPPKTAITGNGQGHCTCGCHDRPQDKPTYVNASVQTDGEIGEVLRVNIASDNSSMYSEYYDTSINEIDTPLSENPLTSTAPVMIGRMIDYYNNPRYRLGDSLQSMYYYVQQPAYEDQRNYEEEPGGLLMARRRTV